VRRHPLRLAGGPPASREPDNRDQRAREQLEAVIRDLKAATLALTGVVRSYVDEAHVEALRRNKP
jgi:hypothetical protein